MEQEQYTQAVMLGQVLIRVISTRVEPFSGNALYYPRGIGTMEQYKTVKEVCALTGLTGKHLYYFHHENVVRAAAYANYSVEGNDGYKLYDEAGVEKLQQIALLVGAAGEGELGKRVKDTLAPKQAVEILNGIEALLEAPNTEITSRVGV